MSAALRKHNGNQAAVARSLGVTRQSVNDFIGRNAEILRPIVEECREVFIDEVEKAMHSQAKSGNVTAQIFILKTLGKRRGYVEREDGSISLAVLAQVTEELGKAVVTAVKEVGLDEPTSTKLFDAIQSKWDAIKLEPDRTRNSRTAQRA